MLYISTNFTFRCTSQQKFNRQVQKTKSLIIAFVGEKQHEGGAQKKTQKQSNPAKLYKHALQLSNLTKLICEGPNQLPKHLYLASTSKERLLKKDNNILHQSLRPYSPCRSFFTSRKLRSQKHIDQLT